MWDLYQELKYIFPCYQHVQKNSISTAQIIQSLPNPLPIQKVPFLSNPIPYPEYLNSSISLCLVKLTAPNKQFSNVR